MTSRKSLISFNLKTAGILTVAAFCTIQLYLLGAVQLPTIQIDQTPSAPKVVAKATSGARIYFTPSEIVADTTSQQVTTQNVSVYADTGGNTIGKIELHMGYNPSTLQKVAFFPDNPSKVAYSMSHTIDIQKGQIDYTLAFVQDTSKPAVLPQVLRLGTVSFQVAPGASSDTLSFLSTTAVYPVTNSSVASAGTNTSSPQSILDQTTPLTITTLANQ